MNRAFSLVELLVVVTIIVVLLALLTPAMDKAIYQAELATCAARQKAIVSGVLLYALERKRHYPIPPAGRRPPHQPDELGQENVPAQDVRRVVDGYISLDLLVCPLDDFISVAYEDNRVNSVVFSNYDLWFGMTFARNIGGGRGMRRIGDRLEWDDVQRNESNRLRILASDKNYQSVTGFDQSTHPDRTDVLSPFVFDNQSGLGSPIGVVVNDEVVGGSATYARWVGGSATNPRGALDLNFAFDDGSVERFSDVARNDSRLRRVPAHANDANANVRNHVPTE